MYVKILQKITLLKTCGTQSRLCLFMFPPNTLKQLNSLSTLDTKRAPFMVIIKIEYYKDELNIDTEMQFKTLYFKDFETTKCIL